jgi:hypothetical protein
MLWTRVPPAIAIALRSPFRLTVRSYFSGANVLRVAMCWFPVANGETFVRPLGLDPSDPDFLSQRKRHIVDLVVRGMRIQTNSAVGQPELAKPSASNP